MRTLAYAQRPLCCYCLLIDRTFPIGICGPGSHSHFRKGQMLAWTGKVVGPVHITSPYTGTGEW